MKTSTLCERIVTTLSDCRGQTITVARGYAAIVKLAQRMKLDHGDPKVLSQLKDALKNLESTGQISVVWTGENHASSIALVGSESTKERVPDESQGTEQTDRSISDDAADYAALLEVEIERLKEDNNRCLQEFVEVSEENEALERRLNNVENERDALRASNWSLKRRIEATEAQLQQIKQEVRAQKPVTLASESTAQLQSRIDELERDTAELHSLRKAHEELHTLVDRLHLDVRQREVVIAGLRRCHDTMVWDLGYAPDEHSHGVKLERGGRIVIMLEE